MQYSATPGCLAAATRHVLMGGGVRARRAAHELKEALGKLRPTREVARTILADLSRAAAR